MASYTSVTATPQGCTHNSASSSCKVPNARRYASNRKALNPNATEGGGDVDSTVNLTYNPAGQIQSRTQSNDAAYTWASSGADKTLGLGYDRGNRLTSSSSSIITLNDVRGNLQGFVSPYVMGNNNRYLYDVESRLSSVTSASKPFASLKYDPSGMLSNLTTPQSSTDYLYDGDDLIAEYQSGALLRRYIHGDGPDEPVASYEGAGLSTRYYLHADERGSVVAVSDATGAGVATSKYSVDGASASLASEFGFTGQLWLPSVQLYYFKARMYSPQLGRFMQRDPLGYAAGLNLYAYAGGDPVNARDPSGLAWECIGGYLYRMDPKPTSMPDDALKSKLAEVAVSGHYEIPPCVQAPTLVVGAAPNPNQGGAGNGGAQGAQDQTGCHPSQSDMANSGIVNIRFSQGSATAGATSGDAFGTFTTTRGYGGIFHTYFDGAFYGAPGFGVAYGTGKSRSLATFNGVNYNVVATLGPYSFSDNFDPDSLRHVGYTDEASTIGLGLGVTRSVTTLLVTTCPGPK